MVRKTIKKPYIGVDEVGRGALAGPLVICAVVIPLGIRGSKSVKDSKKLSAKERIHIFKKYKNKLHYAFGIVNNAEIDLLGLTLATELAILRALNCLKLYVHDLISHDLLIDGNFKFNFSNVSSTTSIIKGDDLFFGISLASIFAKVYRDQIMRNYHTIFPLYNFESNVGYGSSSHMHSITVNSNVRIHRKLFLRKLYEKNINCR